MPIKCLEKVKQYVSKCQVLWEAWVIAISKVPSNGWEIKQRSLLQGLINDFVAFFMTEIFPGN